jgi:putative transposase
VPETGFSSLPEAQAVIAQYVTGYYSLIRPHTFNGGLTPAATEARYQLAS